MYRDTGAGFVNVKDNGRTIAIASRHETWAEYYCSSTYSGWL
ncbi:hypothetical protein [Anabaena sp. CCY 9910]